MLKTKLARLGVLGVAMGLVGGTGFAQEGESGADGLSLLEPVAATRRIIVDDRYDFPELSEADAVEPFGASVSSMDAGLMSNFRRAYFIDERAFVLQLPGSGRYYLGILETPSVFEGRCARRPEALSKAGGSYILSCNSRGMRVARFYVIEDGDQLEEVTARLEQ